MSTHNLGIDSEELSWDVIPKIEKSFGITFGFNDFAAVSTYGEFCDVVKAKLPAISATNCTTQQAFYKLRQALIAHTNSTIIHLDTALSDILPTGQQRRQAVKEIERELAMGLG